jgi:hypothetical protein
LFDDCLGSIVSISPIDALLGSPPLPGVSAYLGNDYTDEYLRVAMWSRQPMNCQTSIWVPIMVEIGHLPGNTTTHKHKR